MNTWGYKIVLFDSGVDADIVYQVYKNNKYTHKSFWSEKEAITYIRTVMEDGDSYKGELK